MEAVIVIDMIKDFVYGKFGGEGAQAIIDNLRNLLKEAEKRDIDIIYAEDLHSKDDPELDVWDEHAIEGTEGSQRIEELKDFEGETLKKSTFDAFYDSSLEKLLEKNHTDKVILSGVSTDICVQNTAAGALYRGIDIVVLEDCTAAISEEKHEDSLEYMKTVFGANIITSKELIKGWKKENK